MVAAAFSQRRKTLRNALAGLLDPAGIAAAGVGPTARAETLAPAQFADLAARLPGIAGQDDHDWSPRPGDL